MSRDREPIPAQPLDPLPTSMPLSYHSAPISPYDRPIEPFVTFARRFRLAIRACYWVSLAIAAVVFVVYLIRRMLA